jgi:hypothetical protein
MLMDDLVKSRESLPALIDRAAQRLAEAKTSAEVAEARKAAKACAALAKVCDATREVHADCLRIITKAESRLADEVDKAQAKGEVAKAGSNPNVRASDNQAATLKELNIPRQRLAEWRRVRDAGEGVVEQIIQQALSEARTPSKAEILERIPVKVPVKIVSQGEPMFKAPIPYSAVTAAEPLTHENWRPAERSKLVVPVITQQPAEPPKAIMGAAVLQAMQARQLADELTALVRDWSDKADRWRMQELSDESKRALKLAIDSNIARLHRVRQSLEN